MIICAVGVFIDISVITVAPIALAIGKKAGYHKEALLLAMIGVFAAVAGLSEMEEMQEIGSVLGSI